jgi:hypothetical protein
MNEPKTLEEKIAKLPAWAREHIETLTRERAVAVREMTEFLDHQTKSSIFVETNGPKSTGELRPFLERVYIQSDQITIEAHGVELRVMTKYGSTNDDSIVLQWGTPDCGIADVAFIPLSYQQARLITKKNMR